MWILAFAIAMVPLLLSAQDIAKQPPATIQVEGEAVVQAKPDRSQVDLGVTAKCAKIGSGDATTSQSGGTES